MFSISPTSTLFLSFSKIFAVNFLTEVKRRPLPPQTHSYMTSSATGPVYRDPPPHSIANPPSRDMDTRGRHLDNSNPPRRPRHASVSPPEYRGGIPRQHDTGRSNNVLSQVPPGVDAQMDVDREHLERSSYLPPPGTLRGSRSQAEERIEPPEGPRSKLPLSKPTVPMGFHSGVPQVPNSTDYTNSGSQSRSLQPLPAHGASRYDQKTDGYLDRNQGQSEKRPAMEHGDRGGPPVSA